jgi:hypothetical protein
MGFQISAAIMVDPDAAYQEESIDKNVKEEGGKHVARVIVVPHADLDRDDYSRVDQKEGA